MWFFCYMQVCVALAYTKYVFFWHYGIRKNTNKWLYFTYYGMKPFNKMLFAKCDMKRNNNNFTQQQCIHEKVSKKIKQFSKQHRLPRSAVLAKLIIHTHTRTHTRTCTILLQSSNVCKMISVLPISGSMALVGIDCCLRRVPLSVTTALLR